MIESIMLEVSKLVALGGLVAEPVCVASRCADSVRLGKQVCPGTGTALHLCHTSLKSIKV